MSAYESLVNAAVILGQYLEMIHMYASSEANVFSIMSCYPPTIRGELMSAPYTPKISGVHVRASATGAATIMCIEYSLAVSYDMYVPNQFVLLFPRKEQQSGF